MSGCLLRGWWGGRRSRWNNGAAICIVASDAHDPSYRSTRLDKAREVVREQYGNETAEALFTENPRDVVEGNDLPGGRLNFSDAPKSWWQFWK